MAATKKPIREETETPPDQRQVNTLQAKRLAALTGVAVKELEGATIAQLGERLKWQIDPIFFLFRRICGKVVKKDPITGVEYPVPFATVYVEDTDCNLITYFPHGSPYVWHFPFFCTREVIGTTKTDACGNFCVWVPRFDIDWILRWRLERVCYPIIFRRPTIGDLIPRLPVPVVGPWPPIPDPDPGPLRTLTTLPPSVVEAIAGRAAGKLAQRVARLQATQSVGNPDFLKAGLLNARAFETELPPPLPAEFHRALAGRDVIAARGASATEGIRSAIALKLGLEPAAKEIAGFDLKRFIGPFFRCYDIIVPEWQIIFDVPDITFRVTQDTNGDGTQETIYSEGYFDVRWDAGALPDVTLVASPIARETHFCRAPVVPCGDVPEIVLAGVMSLTDPTYFDAANGYAVRPNRPSNDGINPHPNNTDRDAQTPFCWAVHLFGCVDLGGATYYRILQSVDGITFLPITGQGWNNFANDGRPIAIGADTNGWYEVNPTDPAPPHATIPRGNLEQPNLLLEWPAPDGKTIVKIELGDAGKNHIADYSDPVAIQSDNTIPTVDFNPLNWLAWKFSTEDDSQLRLLGKDCPLIQRGAIPRDIVVVFQVNVSADHLRDASLWTRGCGGGSSFAPASHPLNKPIHWHTSAADNNVNLYQRYSLEAGAKPGCYSFGCTANSRVVSPEAIYGEDHLPTPDWYANPVYIYTEPWISVAVVNEDAS
jgi:hypothetical protein